MLVTNSARSISFHSDFYCIGFDANKVKQGIEDKTELSAIDQSKKWNKGVVACKKIYYKDVNLTKEQAIENNEIYSQYPIV